ncbi:hypothetical protein HanPSC8_Chr11g0498271 [Helianthus annuus]|nr:hypothetical protein HanPSC8_Chr11g0498271 [Helianthus annuus]
MHLYIYASAQYFGFGLTFQMIHFFQLGISIHYNLCSIWLVALCWIVAPPIGICPRWLFGGVTTCISITKRLNGLVCNAKSKP